jgi:hypothetical protein
MSNGKMATLQQGWQISERRDFGGESRATMATFAGEEIDQEVQNRYPLTTSGSVEQYVINFL